MFAFVDQYRSRRNKIRISNKSMGLNELYVLVRNDAVTVHRQAPTELPLFNYVLVHVVPDTSRRNLHTLEALYKYGQREEEELEIQLGNLEVVSKHLDGALGAALTDKILGYTGGWDDREASRLLGSLEFPELEAGAGTSREQMILDTFTASLALYLALVEFSRTKSFWDVAPLPFTFSATSEANPLCTSSFHHYLHPTRIASLVGSNEMGVKLSLAVVEFLTVWSQAFRPTKSNPCDMGTVITDTVSGFEEYLLEQVTKACKTTEQFEQALGQINNLHSQLRQQLITGDSALTTAMYERVARQIDTLLERKSQSVNATMMASVVESIKQSFQRHLSEVARNYEPVLKDQIDDLVQKAVQDAKITLERTAGEIRHFYEDTRKAHSEVATALSELRGLPSELQQLRRENASLGERLRALEQQVARMARTSQ